LRRQFGIDFDQRITRICDVFQKITSETLKKLSHYDVVQEVNSILKQESKTFMNKASSNLRAVKVSVNEIKLEVKKISSMVTEVNAIL